MVTWPAIDELVSAAESAISSGDVNKMKQVSTQIAEYKANREPATITAIANDGSYGHEEKVRKDHVIDSKEMSDAISNELAKEEKLDSLIVELEQGKKNVQSTVSTKENFFNGLYSGVISVNIPKISYTEMKFGMTNEVALSDPKMEPAGKYVPLYQAYLTYKAMTDEEKGKINDLIDARLSDVGAWQAAMQDSCDKLLETFSDRYLGLMQQQAMKLPEQTDEIVNLLLEFRQGIENFKLMYGLM